MILCLFLVFGACFCSCAQSGNGRHNSHQRKIHQQEESCQNLTDFTPARVPSKVDIFTAYNDSLQCSHECVRTAVPIYTDEMIQQTPVYKTAYNGNRYWLYDRWMHASQSFSTWKSTVWMLLASGLNFMKLRAEQQGLIGLKQVKKRSSNLCSGLRSIKQKQMRIRTLKCRPRILTFVSKLVLLLRGHSQLQSVFCSSKSTHKLADCFPSPHPSAACHSMFRLHTHKKITCSTDFYWCNESADRCLNCAILCLSVHGSIKRWHKGVRFELQYLQVM